MCGAISRHRAAVLGDGGRRPRDAVVAGRPPYVRLALLALGVTAVASAGIDPAPLRSIALLATGIGLVALFLLRDAASAGARMLPADLFRRKTTTQPGLILLFLFSILLVPLSAYGPVLMIGLHGISALEAGYVIATVSFGWSGATILLSGLPPRYEIPVIGGGFVLVALAVPALALVLGSGPVWVIALVGALDGAGFGMAWTYLMKRMTENQDAAEGNRIAGAMSTISRMGYALGAGLTGLAANLAGFADVMDPTTARSVAFWIFAALVPVALGGLSALALFVVRSRA